MDESEVRIDKWLWAVRLFKTRTQAIEACRAGHVKVEGERVKPARELRVGETLTVQLGPRRRTVRVLALLDRRVGAKQVVAYLEDLTPPEEDSRRRETPGAVPPVRDRGMGRPTKRDRRLLDRFLELPTDPD